MGETVPPEICLNDYELPRVVHVIGYGIDKIWWVMNFFQGFTHNMLIARQAVSSEYID